MSAGAVEGSEIIRCFSTREHLYESTPLAAVVSCSNGRKGIWVSEKLKKMISVEVLVPFSLVDEKPVIAEVVLNSERSLRDVYLFREDFPLIDDLSINRLYQVVRAAFRRRLGVVVHGVVQVSRAAATAQAAGEREAGARGTIDFVKYSDEE